MKRKTFLVSIDIEAEFPISALRDLMEAGVLKLDHDKTRFAFVEHWEVVDTSDIGDIGKES